MTDDLIAFVRAALDERERAAQAVLSFESAGFEWEYAWLRMGRHNGRVTRSSHEPGAPTPRDVLADVASKRRILAQYEGYASDDDPDHEHAQFAADAALVLKGVIKLLAQPYAGRPGWREEWKVDES